MLNWLRKVWSLHKAPKLPVKDITFVSEQDGVPERELKSKLVECFYSYPNLRSAFLVRVRYPEEDEMKVALCFNATQEDQKLLQKAATVFRNMFGSDQSLDIIFLSPELVCDISHVSSPFYTREPS